MGFLKRLFGKEKADDNPYVVSGLTTLLRLPSALSLPGGNEGILNYTPDEKEAIERELASFQKLANENMGGEAVFHPEAIEPLQRTLTANALLELAEMACMFSDDTPEDWKAISATYVKAWMATFNPQALQGLGNLMLRAGQNTEAKAVLQVLLLFPTYANTYFADKQTPDVVNSIVSQARDSLRALA
jgi:hypothetical protein